MAAIITGLSSSHTHGFLTNQRSNIIHQTSPLLAWRNWQTRTAQDRMGQPVEVRVLSRAIIKLLRRWTLTERSKREQNNRATIMRQVGPAALFFRPRLSSCRPASFHQLGKPLPPGSGNSTFFLGCSCFYSRFLPCPTSLRGGCKFGSSRG